MPAAGAIQIGKFEILATYTYARALIDGTPVNEAKERRMVAAIMGAQARSGHPRDHQEANESAEKKKKKTITAECLDHQVANKMGEFFEKTFLPVMKKFVQDGLSYDDVKRRLKVPATWGTKISSEQFEQRASF